MLPPPPPVSPLPPPVSRTPAGPDLEKIKLSGEDWLKNRAGTCPKSYLEVPRAPGPPVIDGDLTDPCWKEAARAAEFTWGPENVPIPEGVTVLICYDDSAVYVAFECKDPDIDNVMRKATETRESVWDDDSVELFFDANRDYGTYVQLLANVDAVTQTYENVGGKPKETPIQGFEVKTKLYPYHWAVEFSLSYAALRGNSPRPGTVWTAQFVRNGRAPEAAKNYSGSWAKLWAGSTHRPETFGFLAFK